MTTNPDQPQPCIARFSCELFTVHPEALRSARVAAGLTLEKLAALTGKTRSWIHRLETVGGRLDSDDLDAIMKLLMDHGVRSYTED